GRAQARVPAGADLRHPLRHHQIRRAVDPRGVQDAVRGRRPRAHRHPGVPAGLARDADPGDDGAGHHHRRLRGHGGARIHRQFLDPVRDRAGDRHRGGRRDRGGRGRRPQHREGHVGPRGRERRQFALVIAATALLSAINAATLKPTQSAMWLRPAVPPERRNVFYRAFNRVYDRIERWYAGLIAGMVARSALMAAVALALIAATGYWFSRVPPGFLPIEEQGYMIALVQLPDGASLERTQQTLDKVFEIARKTPGVARVVNIAGVSALDNSATLSSAAVSYIILKDWSERGKGEDLMPLFNNLNAALGAIPEA